MNNLALSIEDEDPARARELWERAVELGDVRAMYHLARNIEGDDLSRALELYERAARMGDEDAQDALRRLGED